MESAGRRSEYYPNMGIVRYLMALGVLVAHAGELAGYDIPFFIGSFECVGGFFVLSGFLMFKSFERSAGTLDYLKKRARLILPPYFFIVLVCAVSLCAVSTLPLREYFQSSQLYSYLAANISFLNWLEPSLPGVFQGDGFVSPAVNGSLWTMKVEWCLYLSVPVFVWFIHRLGNRGRTVAAAMIVVFSIGYRYLLEYLYNSTGNELYNILGRQVMGQLAYFYMGMLIYFVRRPFLNHINTLLMASLVLFVALRFMPAWSHTALMPVVLSALVLSVSCHHREIRLFNTHRNISYDIYLAHYPIVQVGVYLALNTLPWYVFLAYTLAATIIVAYITNRLTR